MATAFCNVGKASMPSILFVKSSQQSQCRLYVDWPSCRPGFEELSVALSVVHHLKCLTSTLFSVLAIVVYFVLTK